VLPEPHWDAISPDRPLRRHRLVALGGGESLAARQLRIDEAVLHRITGLGGGSLDGLIDADPVAAPLTASQLVVAEELAVAVEALGDRVLVRVDGADPDTRAALVSAVARRLGRGVLRVRDELVDDGRIAEVAATVGREAILDQRLVLTSHQRLLGVVAGPVIATDAAVEVPGRVTVARTVALPSPSEQLELWRASTRPDTGVEPVTRELAHHFRLSARAIGAVAAEWNALPGEVPDGLRRLARERARVGFGPLALRVEPRATWADLVLPPAQRELLHDIERQVRHRARVYGDWGMAAHTSQGLGVSVLFAGESGTGKTMAAEVLAGSLALDLYRVDLSAMVSKYIGETEKNLGSVFEAAEASGAVLLFDEADALFGRRSEVRDSHDRYANLEVAYLLQRMEAYRGLAILTTNLRGNVDRAFLRRIRFVVQFPFPDAAARAELWRLALPEALPVAGLDPLALAQLQLSGGAIRSIALSAAFAAADAGTPVDPALVLRAARLEAAKAERPLTDAETAAIRAGVRP
jgi:vesicle-fusing ATPase